MIGDIFGPAVAALTLGLFARGELASRMGIWGVLTPLVVADLMRGTSRYNLALGAVATAQGFGASLSGLAAGLVVDHFGYDAAFIVSAAGALLALIVLGLALPETARIDRSVRIA